MGKTRIALTAALALAGAALVAAPASAETLTANACAFVDVHATDGTTIDFVYAEDCATIRSIYLIDGGSPTVEFAPGGYGALVWHQAVEPVNGVCEEGYSLSWGQWAREGQGGAACVRDIEWGYAPYVDGHLYVTINTENDHVRLFTQAYPFAAGCAFGDELYPIEGNCPPD